MKRLILILMAVLAGGMIMAGESTILNADSKHITYSGRMDFTDPLAPRFDWPGVSISLNFEGQDIGARIEDGGNDYNIFIDGKLKGILSTEKDKRDYLLAKGLKKGKHSVMLTKRTEGYDGVAVFKGFALYPGGKPLAPTATLEKKILFIGDSLTVGYGVEGKSIKCDSERKYKNNYLAFSSVAARALNMEHHVVAISGRGVVRNYGEKTKSSKEPLPIYVDRMLMNDGILKWDYKSWVPDVVVINLGTNDFSTEPKPDKKVFTKAYLKLIKKVRAYYPKTGIFICDGPTQSEPFFECIADMKKSINDKNIHWVKMAPLTEKDWGCDYHPNIKAAKRMAAELVNEIKKTAAIVK